MKNNLKNKRFQINNCKTINYKNNNNYNRKNCNKNLQLHSFNNSKNLPKTSNKKLCKKYSNKKLNCKWLGNWTKMKLKPTLTSIIKNKMIVSMRKMATTMRKTRVTMTTMMTCTPMLIWLLKPRIANKHKLKLLTRRNKVKMKV